jgi:hypothetical protein
VAGAKRKRFRDGAELVAMLRRSRRGGVRLGGIRENVSKREGGRERTELRC